MSSIKTPLTSEEILAHAVSLTGAALLDFKNEPHYVVHGSFRSYAVNAKTNEVYDYPGGKFICVVSPGHIVHTGKAATAERLLALYNDRKLTKEIKTLLPT